MRKTIFWKVKLELHRAPLTHISAALQVVWAPHLSYTCRTSPPWSQGFVTEADTPSVGPFSTGFHPVWVFLWTWASTCFRHLTFKLDLLWYLNRCGWVFCFLLFFFFFLIFSFFSVLIRMGYSTTVSPTQCQYTCSRGLLDSQLQLYKCTQENLPCYPPPTDWGSNCTFLLTMTGESKQWNRIMGELSHFPSCFHWFVHTILIIMKGLCV